MTERRIDVDQIARALDEVHFLQEDKAALEEQIREMRSMCNEMRLRNEWYEQENERVRIERDKYQAFSVNLVTRLQVMGESVNKAVEEAGRHAIVIAERQRENRRESLQNGTAPPLREPMRVRNPHSVPPREEHPHVAPPAPPRQPIRPDAEPEPEVTDIFNRLQAKTPLAHRWP